jgi:peptide chain release factor 1
MTILKARLYDLQRRRQMAARNELRSLAQGTGDRSDKIRTYNFPQVSGNTLCVVFATDELLSLNFIECQDRVTDHRASITVNGVERVLDGKLDAIVDELILADERLRVESFLESLSSNKSKR